jgi:hypothetical protein
MKLSAAFYRRILQVATHTQKEFSLNNGATSRSVHQNQN